MKKKIVMGESDFKEIIQNGYYYIDKSLYIKDIIDDTCKAILISRPHKFGKTVNMSMLDYFFNIDKKDSKELFNGLKIMEQGEEYTSKMGAYPCIYLSFKKLKASSYDEFLNKFNIMVRDAYLEHIYLLDCDKFHEYEINMMNKAINMELDDFLDCYLLKQLTRYLNKYYDKQVYVFIDDFDLPYYYGEKYNYYKDISCDLDRLFTCITKDNIYVHQVIISGISSIPKHSIFSGSNVLEYTMLNNRFSKDFGITSEEMDKIIKDYGIEDEKEEIRKWYGGYKIGDEKDIYNPWSVLNFVKNKEFKQYLNDTNINDLNKITNLDLYKLNNLLNDEEIEKYLHILTSYLDVINDKYKIWELLVQEGFFSVVEEIKMDEYIIKITNLEIKGIFEKIVNNWFNNETLSNSLNDILADLINLNLKAYEEKLKKLVEEVVSYMDVGENVVENFYHAFVLGMLVGLKDKYYVRSNRESGYGRYDIMLEPINKQDNAFIMEFKVYEKDYEKNIDKTLQKAKQQIENKGYETELNARGCNNITKIVYAFNGKDVILEWYK